MRDPLNQELDDLRAENARFKTERKEIAEGLSEMLDNIDGLLESMKVPRDNPIREQLRKSRDKLLVTFK